MDISSPPAIRVSNPGRYPSPPVLRSPSENNLRYPSPAAPMSIPHRKRDASPPPPPLPPPRDVEELGLAAHEPGAPGWIWTNNPNWDGFGSGRPEIEEQGGRKSSQGRLQVEENYEIDPARRASSLSTITATHNNAPAPVMRRNHSASEEEARLGALPSLDRLHSEKQLEQRTLDDSSNAYDRNLLSKIGGPNTPQRTLSSASLTLSTGMPENAPSTSPGAPERSAQKPASLSVAPLKRLSVPERRKSSFDSTSPRWNGASATSASAISPGSFRSPPYDIPEINRPFVLRNPSLASSVDSPSHRGSYDSTIFMQEDFPSEEGQFKDLNLNDRPSGDSEDLKASARAGMKRRASSPHRESTREERASVGSISSTAGTNDLYHRRSIQQFPNRNSPLPRYQNAHHGSVSSQSSYGQRTSSLCSSVGLSVASSATSLASGRVSPNPLSPAIDPELASGTSHAAVKTFQPSPQGSSLHTSQQRALSDTPKYQPPKHIEEQGPPLDHVPPAVSGMFICDCCPKKPKKFKTEEDLRLHHMEKQYTCAFCPNRFKNKNEAERHQNSLHLRRHSWSCAALPTVEHAFHPSGPPGSASDTCGFCGEEFLNPPDWIARHEHLSSVHKFGECNQTKKFYRADHFRQHLKHSHAGTSGKWTNQLETACMRDEPIPQNVTRGPSTQGPGMPHPGQASSSSSNAPMISSGLANKPTTIDELLHER